MMKNKINFKFKTQLEANSEFLQFCSKGDIRSVESILFYNNGIVPDVKCRHPAGSAVSPIDYCIITAIRYRQLDLLKFFFEDERTKDKFNYERLIGGVLLQ